MATTYRQIVFMCLDELKVAADDSYFSEEHVIFLASKYRGLLLKQTYKDIKKEIPESNYQTLCLNLIPVPAISGEECEGGTYLRSEEKIPFLMTVATPRVYAVDYYQGEITYVSRERMRYVGYNRWLPNIIYASIGPDNFLYLKSFNPQYLNLREIKLTGVFEDSDKASEFECESSNICDILDREFPLEEALISQLIQLVVKELSASIYKPADPENDASDDLSDLATFIRNNVKSNLQKQIEN
jgi:hypothetical protein